MKKNNRNSNQKYLPLDYAYIKMKTMIINEKKMKLPKQLKY